MCNRKKVNRKKKENPWAIVMWEEEYMDEGAVKPTKQKKSNSMQKGLVGLLQNNLN